MDILPISDLHFKKLISMVGAGAISSRVAKDILLVMATEDTDPEEYAKNKGLMALNDSVALMETVTSVIQANPTVVADFKAGKAAALEFLLGQCMRALRGAGKPETLRELLVEEISKI